DPKLPLPLANLGSQKNHMALYLMCIYMDGELQKWFQQAWRASGKKLDMGKSCIRFKKIEDLSLEVIGQVFARVPVKAYIERMEQALSANSRKGSKKPRK